ncbi:MAG TPA: hypothetical protein VK766_05395 [Cytophagaceae bacterium]|jgi:hypothetical protein|nr:hypothetical protein [Cytophagaceae bacterium]
MSKLKNIIKQLSVADFSAIFDSLMESNAEKSALLLKFMREKQLSDNKIMDELNVNSNAYYTLRSRLNQKIEEHLLQQMETPRITLLKKVATINEIIFTKKKAISIATLKKLEKELMDYDLSSELTIIYKNLKKLHIGSPDYYNYSQLYNKHIAYMLAVDKAEELVAQYFYRYGDYLFTKDDIEQQGLLLLKNEIDNVGSLYKSHRLYVYQSCVDVFHRIFIDGNIKASEDAESIEAIFDKVQGIFDLYFLDATYFHLKPVFEYLKFEYYYMIDTYRNSESNYENVNEGISVLLTNYGLYTFPPQFLLSKLSKNLSSGTENILYEEGKKLFEDFEIDKSNVPQHVLYTIYRATSCYYVGKYDEAARWINNMLNEQSLKKLPYTLLEVKIFMALQYCLMKDFDLFNQLTNSIQRQVRLLGKDKCQHIIIYAKIFKASINQAKKGKAAKINSYVSKLLKVKPSYYSPFNFIKLDTNFVSRLSQE